MLTTTKVKKIMINDYDDDDDDDDVTSNADDYDKTLTFIRVKSIPLCTSWSQQRGKSFI